MSPQRQNILVAIADPTERSRVVALLAHEGFAATAVPEGLAAVRAAGVTRYALLIVAAQLPGLLDGAVTVRHARLRHTAAKALLIASNPAERRRCRITDADEIIAAPYQPHELIGCVYELLHRRGNAAADFARRARTDRRVS